MSTQHPRARAALVACVAATALAVAACSDANEVADLDPIGPPASAPATDVDAAPVTTADADPTETTSAPVDVSPTSAAVTTAAPPSTSDSDSDSDSDSLTGPQFSDALGTRVDTAPGVRTRGDTRKLLDAGLWVHLAWEPDPQDPSVFTVQPDDIPILEAYANAVTTYYRAATTTLTTDDPDFARYFEDGGTLFESTFSANRATYVESLGSGVVLRPYLPSDLLKGDSAVVLDCYLQDQQWVLIGEDAVLGDLRTRGAVTAMAKIDGSWQVASIGPEPQACL